MLRKDPRREDDLRTDLFDLSVERVHLFPGKRPESQMAERAGLPSVDGFILSLPAQSASQYAAPSLVRSINPYMIR